MSNKKKIKNQNGFKEAGSKLKVKSERNQDQTRASIKLQNQILVRKKNQKSNFKT